ncbi:MAG: septum formation initiator family protein [Bacteroidota bacterium]|nr:septum formation initiator family protein [Bacteroidota bacterium]
MNFLKNIITKYPYLRLFSNKYILISTLFVIWMLFLDNASYLDHRVLNKQIKELENNKAYYMQEIDKDQKQIKDLSQPEKIEQYAREQYYMKKDNEEIFIIEYQNEIEE